MPNVTIFIPADKFPPDQALAELSTHCTVLCTEVLKATLENVHIIYVATRQGRGHPMFVEIKYRLGPFRTQQVMEAFMERLDEVIKRNTGLTARIRCFGYEAPNIHACN